MANVASGRAKHLQNKTKRYWCQRCPNCRSDVKVERGNKGRATCNVCHHKLPRGQ